MSAMPRTRRRFLALAGMAPAMLVAEPVWAQASPTAQPKPPAAGKAKGAETPMEVAPAEDLMREHGVLRRVLLIYEDYERRLLGSTRVEAQPLVEAAQLIRRFVEDYHEKLEEDYLFPRFQQAGQLLDLVATLNEQHARGRELTSRVLDLAKPAALANATQRGYLADALRAFVRMYRPHAAREDTVLFPAFKHLVTPSEYDKLGDKFEHEEDDRFGKNGFEHVVRQVAELEQGLGIYDLKQFTPAL